MAKTSVIIPSRSEQFLVPTVNDLLAKGSDIEIIVVLDGYWANPPLPGDKRLQIIHRGQSFGMRAGINAGAAIAKGKYLLKCDAHTLWMDGYDQVLQADCDGDWVVIPRRNRLDAEAWKEQETNKPPIDYEFLTWPNDPDDWGGAGLHGHQWDAKNRDEKLKSVLIDDQMSFQGSAWFMHRDYFYYLELMDEEHYGTFWQEAQEIGLKCWLSGGQVKVNKKTAYAHLHKGKQYGRGYNLDGTQLTKGTSYTNGWIERKMWHRQTRKFHWMGEHFYPIPTWPINWQEELDRHYEWG